MGSHGTLDSRCDWSSRGQAGEPDLQRLRGEKALLEEDNGPKIYCYVDGRDHGVELNNTHWSGGIREFAI